MWGRASSYRFRAATARRNSRADSDIPGPPRRSVNGPASQQTAKLGNVGQGDLLQYTCGEYQERLAELGMTVSMSRTGNCYDNAVVESFFDSLKTEIGHEVFESREHARREVFEYIELFYNRRRRHSALGYVSPAAFERQRALEVA
jgi:putative transposase